MTCVRSFLYFSMRPSIEVNALHAGRAFSWKFIVALAGRYLLRIAIKPIWLSIAFYSEWMIMECGFNEVWRVFSSKHSKNTVYMKIKNTSTQYLQKFKNCRKTVFSQLSLKELMVFHKFIKYMIYWCIKNTNLIDLNILLIYFLE